jgi:NitT/TauT family transport system substrate-binding protein
MDNTVKGILVFSLALSFGSAYAETSEVRLGYQNGLTYAPFLIMEKNHSIEKHAAKLGIKDLKVTFNRMSGPGPINDALISGAVDAGAIGNPSLSLLNSKTNGKIKAIASLSYMPMLLNTTNPAIKSIADFSEKDKIALPTVKQSVQAVTLQMAVAQKFGQANYAKLDPYTISMSHPEGTIQMLGGKSEIDGHFTALPFQNQEIRDSKGKIHTVLNSYEVLGGKATFVLVAGTTKFATENPKVYQAFTEAIEETLRWINENKIEAAKQYIELSKSKESLQEVLDQMMNPAVEFNSTPRGIMKYNEFMAKVGTIKAPAKSWKELCFPNLHNKPGN